MNLTDRAVLLAAEVHILKHVFEVEDAVLDELMARYRKMFADSDVPNEDLHEQLDCISARIEDACLARKVQEDWLDAEVQKYLSSALHLAQ